MAAARSLAFVSSLPAWGGGEKWLVEAAAAMAGRGHRVCVIGRPGGEVTRRAAALGLDVDPAPMGGWLDPRTLAAFAAILRRREVEVACVNLDKEIRLAGIGGLGLPRFRLVPRRGSPDPIKDNWHYRLVYERLVDRLIVNCHALARTVAGHLPWFAPGRIRVVYNGCDPDALAAAVHPGRLRAELGLGPDRPVVSLVGEVGRRKGQDLLLAAAARLRPLHPRAVYLLAGAEEGPGALASLQAQARDLGLADGAVRFLGFRTDPLDVMADSDVVVLPSRSEGFPNSLLEAMALGRPVLATAVDGIPELVDAGRTGALVPADDLPAFAAELDLLLDDAGRRAAWGEAGRRRVWERFSASAAASALEDCLLAW